ncbi:helix-turn-helix transcriptional regulator [Anaerostipes sp.]|uniref:helix-turn-helix transcriptional regulator n=1 Tax=Anaerostipes sp. TaxID=1872530 RepID=UPI003FF0B8A7
MVFAEKLKLLRKQENMSQEQLAAKLGVSRQAVTKWETGAGIPDIENILSISKLFDISMDELFSNERKMNLPKDYLFESVTEYDIDESKHYDMKFGFAKKLVLSGYKGEKIRVCLASNTISTLQSDFKVKIDDIKKRMDVDINQKNGVTRAAAKEEVNIFVQVPVTYIRNMECAVHAERVEIYSLECDNIELDLKTSEVVLEDILGTVEINCNLDMNIFCNSLNGAIEINQISAVSKIHIPEDVMFAAVTKGIATKISYEKNGKQADVFAVTNADNIIELNGIKSELIISVDR